LAVVTTSPIPSHLLFLFKHFFVMFIFLTILQIGLNILILEFIISQTLLIAELPTMQTGLNWWVLKQLIWAALTTMNINYSIVKMSFKLAWSFSLSKHAFPYHSLNSFERSSFSCSVLEEIIIVVGSSWPDLNTPATSPHDISHLTEIKFVHWHCTFSSTLFPFEKVIEISTCWW
jgi:hypothetical protein